MLTVDDSKDLGAKPQTTIEDAREVPAPQPVKLPTAARAQALLSAKKDTTDQQGKVPKGPPGDGLDFGSPEHQEYGNAGAHQAGYEGRLHGEHSEVPGRNGAGPAFEFSLSHGDIVMLSGDYFDPRDKDAKGKPVPDNLFQLAKTPSKDLGKTVGSQDEIMYAIKDANNKDPRFQKGGAWEKVEFSDAVKDSVTNRYLNLAASNFEHFVNPNGPDSGGAKSGNRHSAGGSYRALHEGAIGMAHDARKKGESIEHGCSSFTAGLDESNLDHLTSLSLGREGGTGCGMTPSA